MRTGWGDLVRWDWKPVVATGRGGSGIAGPYGIDIDNCLANLIAKNYISASIVQPSPAKRLSHFLACRLERLAALTSVG